jgi:hypothetical protein
VYLISQANLIQPVVCGWLTDMWGRWSHRVLLACGVLLAVLQVLMLVSTTTFSLGVLFLLRGVVINQTVDQAFKALAVRGAASFPGTALAWRREQEVQRTGNFGDVCASVLEAVVFGVASAVPEEAGSSIVAVFAISSAIGVALIASTYSLHHFACANDDFSVGGASDELIVDGGRDDDAGSRYSGSMDQSKGAGGEVELVEYREGDHAYSPPARAADEAPPTSRPLGYCRRGCVALRSPTTAWPFAAYVVSTLIAAVVVYPLSLSEAFDMGHDSTQAPKRSLGASEQHVRWLSDNSTAECIGVLTQLFAQKSVGALWYLLVGILYAAWVAGMAPRKAYGFLLPAVAAVMTIASATLLAPARGPVVSTISLGLLDVGSYYSGQFGSWYLAATIPQGVYGFYQMVAGVALALEGVVAAGLIDWMFLEHDPLTAMTLVLCILSGVSGVVVWYVMGQAGEAEHPAPRPTEDLADIVDSTPLPAPDMEIGSMPEEFNGVSV